MKDKNGVEIQAGDFVLCRPPERTHLMLDFKPKWVKAQEKETPRDLLDDAEKGCVTCPICGFAQNYTPESQISRNGARARVGKHCKNFKGDKQEAHLELYSFVFGS